MSDGCSSFHSAIDPLWISVRLDLKLHLTTNSLHFRSRTNESLFFLDQRTSLFNELGSHEFLLLEVQSPLKDVN